MFESGLKTVLLVAVVASAAAISVSASWEFSRDRIAVNQRARMLENLYSVLDAELVGEDLNPVLVPVVDEALLGRSDQTDVFIPLRGREPVAAVFASVAPDGYNAPIYLLVGVSAAREDVMGVRVVSHRETPGLGDLIDIRKSNWIRQFDGTSLANPPAERWAVDKDEGDFDSITGATVTPRAVVKAVRNTLLYFDAHKNELYEAARTASEATDGSTPP